jgi:uncharacterized repeat protein (TIGR03843 family)
VSAHERQPPTSALTVLEQGTIDVKGRMPWSSNGTFLVTVATDDAELPAVYKPHRGERPLWDFPDGLYQREVAAYVLSEALGWGLVPETVIRHDAPLGVGSLQRFVEAHFEEHYFTLLEQGDHHDALMKVAVFDLLANNADRKSGHCLIGLDGRIWGIDHGLCFHDDPKLRTVIWDWGGETIPPPLVADVARFVERGLPPAMCELLSKDETDALMRRARAVVKSACFPDPGHHSRPYPWPLV